MNIHQRNLDWFERNSLDIRLIDAAFAAATETANTSIYVVPAGRSAVLHSVVLEASFPVAGAVTDLVSMRVAVHEPAGSFVNVIQFMLTAATVREQLVQRASFMIPITSNREVEVTADAVNSTVGVLITSHVFLTEYEPR